VFANPVRKGIFVERLEFIDSENMSSFRVSPILYGVIYGSEG
jgi:hypothetical protein